LFTSENEFKLMAR